MSSSVIGWTGKRVQEVINPNGDLRVDSHATRPRGLGVKLLKDLNGEGKIGSQKDLPGDGPLFGLLLRRADRVQEDICINEGCHGDEVLRV